MGYASYLEDIGDRMTSDLTNFFEKEGRHFTELNSVEIRRIVLRIVDQVLGRYATILTDENMNLADEVSNLRKQNLFLKQQVTALNEINFRLQNELKEANNILDDRLYFAKNIDQFPPPKKR